MSPDNPTTRSPGFTTEYIANLKPKIAGMCADDLRSQVWVLIAALAVKELSLERADTVVAHVSARSSDTRAKLAASKSSGRA